jgi:pyruvate dehydrogenase E2 component (dihydrolipoamide acetyltransferase)
MPKEFRLPFLGENIQKHRRKNFGKGWRYSSQRVSVLEIETDKAVAEIPAPYDGRILEIHVKEGQKVKPGILVFTIEESTSLCFNDD